jgi:photosystem II stability/assembly factor-like uncharacterized protein
MLTLMSMRTQLVLVVAGLAFTGCKKSSGPTGGGGGGGGGWFVGSEGLMQNVTPAGTPGHGYDLGSTAELRGIACRYLGEAWVVGAAGTVLYTSDAGVTWTAQAVPTTADLRALATQDFGPVFLAGNGTFLVTEDTGKTWRDLGDGVTAFRSLAAAHAADTVLALADDGGLWSYDGQLANIGSLPGMRAVAVSPDGQQVLAAGAGLMASHDAGKTWTQLSVDPSLSFDDIRFTEDGDAAVAVGAGGAIARIANGAVTVQHAGTANLHTVALDEAGYTAGDGGQSLVTHDDGLTWSAGPNLGATVWGVDEIGDNHR